MEKSEVLKAIRTARRAHIIWVDNVKALVHGLPIKKEEIPISLTSCDFGKWFYCDGQILLSIFREDAVKKLDDKHKELHDIYMEIFKIYFFRGKKSLFKRLFRRGKKIPAKEEYNALVYLAELEKVSNELVSYLNIIEKRMVLITEERFRTLH